MGKRGPQPGAKAAKIAAAQTSTPQPATNEPNATPPATPPSNPNLYRPVESGAPGAGTKTRASFVVKDDGLIDVEAMRSENLARLKELLRDPRNQAALGLTAADEPLILISEEEVSRLYDMLATFEVAIAPLLRIHPEAAKVCLPYDDREKKMLTPSTQAVLSKHAPEFLLKWKDEIMLAGMLAAITRAKFGAAQKMTREIVARLQEQQEAQQRAGRSTEVQQ